jgi:predicted dithiol-disulfide oxidoreductase (DUF899 family)
MSLPEIVSHEEWLVARKDLLAKEKTLTRQRDALNADRRRLPMVVIEKHYVFEGPDGLVSLLDLFGPSRQLIIRHTMFGPDWEKPCPGCTAAMDEMSPALFTHLKSRDTTYVMISRAQYGKIASFKTERGWTLPWLSSFGTHFNYDFGATLDPAVQPLEYNYRDQDELLALDPDLLDQGSSEVPGLSCFLRDGSAVFHTYSTYARGVEDAETGTYKLLDITALGRQEEWEEPKDRVESPNPADPSFA